MRIDRACAAMLLAALLAGCGGSDGDNGAPPLTAAGVQEPPAAGAALGRSAGDASEASRAAVAAADATVARQTSFAGLFGLLGAPLAASAADDLPTLRLVLPGRSDQKKALRVETAACDDFFDAPCSGSATVDTNVADTATQLAVGDYFDMRFNALSGRMGGIGISLQGRMRIEFATALNRNAASLTGLNVLALCDQLSGSLAGHAFGPINDTARLQINGSTRTITAAGRSFTNLSGVTASGAGSYVIGGGTVRSAHWAASGSYVDIAFQAWRSTAGKPAAGSTATLSGASGVITVRVTAVTANTVRYAVTLTSGGASSSFNVTATYAGSAEPTYAAVPV